MKRAVTGILTLFLIGSALVSCHGKNTGAVPATTATPTTTPTTATSAPTQTAAPTATPTATVGPIMVVPTTDVTVSVSNAGLHTSTLTITEANYQGTFTAASLYPGIATVTPTTGIANNATITITAVSVSSTSVPVTITDVSGNNATINVTVTL